MNEELQIEVTGKTGAGSSRLQFWVRNVSMRRIVAEDEHLPAWLADHWFIFTVDGRSARLYPVHTITIGKNVRSLEPGERKAWDSIEPARLCFLPDDDPGGLKNRNDYRRMNVAGKAGRQRTRIGPGGCERGL